ncbi:MAG TPA: universal stress protein [Crinalium sp.]|jgi:nucleotide-binding universal stress UspA family protein
MFQRALICTDFSDGLQRLANFVPSLAASGMKQIVFLHTLPLSEEREVPRPNAEKVEKARDRLSAALSQVPDGIDVKIEVNWGRPIEQILQVSKTYQSELIILGMPSRNLLDEKLFGSTTMELCQRRPAPTLALRPQLISTYTAEELELRCRHLFRYLLIPYDGSETSQYLIQQIKHIAQNQAESSFDQCLLCWVVDDVSRSQELEDFNLKQAQEKLEQVKADLESVGLTVKAQARLGNPVVQMLMAAQEHDISAIATSSASLGKPRGWSVGSFTADILRRSWHPVLYFPPER